MDFTIIDLIAATTNALNGALLATRPSHDRHYTVVGIVLLALTSGIAGSVSRDVLLNDIPVALLNPWYLILTTTAGFIVVSVHTKGSARFQRNALPFMAAFALPWYAAVGANKALEAGLPDLAAIVIGAISATAGRFLLDLISGVTPLHFVRGEWFVATAILCGLAYVICFRLGLALVPATLISFTIAFCFRLLAMYWKWEEPEPSQPPVRARGEGTH